MISGKSCEACIELVDFDAQSVGLPESQRKAKISLLLRQVNEQHDQLCNHLPVEVISRIFSFYPEISEYTTAVVGTSQPQAAFTSPFRITSVCKRWREIGFTTPSLWLSLLISYNSCERDRSCLDGVELLPLWLTRCGTQKLKISIQIGRPFAYSRFTKEINAMFMLIQSCSSQLQALNLTMPIDLHHKFFQEDPLEAPHLTHLQLHQLDVYLRPQPHLLITAPSLDSISISNINMSGLKLDYSRITRVSTVGITGDGVFLLLKTAIQVESATFLESAFNISVVPWGPHVHESLKHLELRLKEGGRNALLCRIFISGRVHSSVPAANLDRFAYADGELQNKLLAFLSRSQCSLVYMELTDINVWAPYSKLGEIFEIVPSLTHLRLSSVHHTTSTSLAQHIFRRLRGTGIARAGVFPS